MLQRKKERRKESLVKYKSAENYVGRPKNKCYKVDANLEISRVSKSLSRRPAPLYAHWPWSTPRLCCPALREVLAWQRPPTATCPSRVLRSVSWRLSAESDTCPRTHCAGTANRHTATDPLIR